MAEGGKLMLNVHKVIKPPAQTWPHGPDCIRFEAKATRVVESPPWVWAHLRWTEKDNKNMYCSQRTPCSSIFCGDGAGGGVKQMLYFMSQRWTTTSRRFFSQRCKKPASVMYGSASAVVASWLISMYMKVQLMQKLIWNLEWNRAETYAPVKTKSYPGNFIEVFRSTRQTSFWTNYSRDLKT